MLAAAHSLRWVAAGVLLLAWVALAAAGERGLLWQVESPQGRVSYLFGTMHIDDARVTEFSPKLRAALAASDSFMLEALPPRDASVLFLPAGSLRELLSEQEMEAVRRQADIHALSESMLLRMKPWLLALVFSRPQPAGPFTQDMQLLALASGQGKPVLALETAQEHFAALDGLSQAEQLALLRSVLAQTQQEKEQGLADLLEAYLGGDSASIAALDESISSRGLPPGLWQKMRDILITRRNATMAQRMLQQMAAGTVFVAVGAAHLQGQGGLLPRLRAAGYSVRALE